MNFNRVIAAPKYFTASNILEFLNKCAPLFDLVGKGEPNFLFDLTKVEELSVLGALLFYKVVEFTSINGCFYRPSIKFERDSAVGHQLQAYGFWRLIEDFMEDRGSIQDYKRSLEKSYRSLEVKIEDDFIIAPQALLRDSDFSSKALKINFLPRIESYYSNNPKAVSMIFLCLSEVLLNFWEHAVEDSKSIIVANGNHQNIEIACADTGRGIVSTLKDSGEVKQKNPSDVLMQSVKKGVTSKKGTHHMGYGLWILDQIVKMVKGRFYIYSEGAYYENNFGKVKFGECAYWGGTIVYLSLPLTSPKTLCDIEDHAEKSKFANLKINW